MSSQKATETESAAIASAIADLSSRRVEPRYVAAEALGDLPCGRRSAPPELIRATSDPDGLVRICAVEALGYIGDPASYTAARASLKDPSAIVRSYAAVSAVLLGGPKARSAIVNAAGRERSARARVGLAEARFLLGDRAAVADVVYLLRSRQYRVRCAAANTLADLPLTRSERAEALRALGAALAVESTKAARSTIVAARRDLRQLARADAGATREKRPFVTVDGGLPDDLDMSNREHFADWMQRHRTE
jgi:HEAT repeat protein